MPVGCAHCQVAAAMSNTTAIDLTQHRIIVWWSVVDLRMAVSSSFFLSAQLRRLRPLHYEAGRLLKQHFFDGQRLRWIKVAHTQRRQASEVESLRNSVKRRAPYGSEEWTTRIANVLRLKFTLRPRGRSKTCDRVQAEE